MSVNSTMFKLGAPGSAGIACNAEGLFVAETPRLDRYDSPAGGPGWRVRPLDALNTELGRRYGLPIDMTAKLGGLRAVANALNDEDLVRAQIATLQLRLPDPPPAQSRTGDEIVALVRGLLASDMLTKSFDGTFDETRHPRWPAGSPDSVGGRFSPADAAGAADATEAPPAARDTPQRAGNPQPAPQRPHHPAPQPQPSPLATSLNRRLQALSKHDQAFLASIESRITDPANGGVVYFASRDEALKDMGLCFMADIVRYDEASSQLERGAWLQRDPNSGQWFYDRSQMRVGMTSKVQLALATPQVDAAYANGDLVNVHIHPLIASTEANADANNEANHTFSTPSPDGPGDAGAFAAISRQEQRRDSTVPPLQAAVIGSDGSI